MEMEKKREEAGKRTPARNIAHERVRTLTAVALFAALMAVTAQITVPLTVPFTLQLFAVFLALTALGGKWGTLAVAVYIALGAVGLPVFAAFRGGVGVLLGATGGYIWGFLFSGLTYWLLETVFQNERFWVRTAKMCAALVVCYLLGTLWFWKVYTDGGKEIGVGKILMLCVVPYILPDLAKILLAVKVGDILKKRTGTGVKGRL